MRRLRIGLLTGAFWGLVAAAAQSPATGADHVPETSIDHVPETSIDAGKVVARPAQTFRGWGMSLAWEANDLYGGGRQPARINSQHSQSGIRHHQWRPV